MELTPNLEDYLKTIYRIEKTLKVVRTRDIAKKMNVKPPSAVAAIEKLKKMDLLEKEYYGAVNLTIKGRMLAEEIEKTFDILYRFFSEFLGSDSLTSKRDACAVEHCLSRDSLACIEVLLDGGTGGLAVKGEARQNIDQ